MSGSPIRPSSCLTGCVRAQEERHDYRQRCFCKNRWKGCHFRPAKYSILISVDASSCATSADLAYGGTLRKNNPSRCNITVGSSSPVPLLAGTRLLYTYRFYLRLMTTTDCTDSAIAAFSARDLDRYCPSPTSAGNSFCSVPICYLRRIDVYL